MKSNVKGSIDYLTVQAFLGWFHHACLSGIPLVQIEPLAELVKTSYGNVAHASGKLWSTSEVENIAPDWRSDLQKQRIISSELRHPNSIINVEFGASFRILCIQ